ncbi:MAG: glutamine synthetase type III, partial [Clostridia bacterium]|nr:glutamine synthetase type III [Clostridia bacterium]
EEINDIIRDIIKEHKRILYNGNNYSEEWKAEAERRGLTSLPTTVDAIEALTSEKNIKLLTKHDILTEAEITSRYEINLEMYSKVINIESLTMQTMAEKSILPAVEAYCGALGRDISSVEGAGGKMTKSREKLSLICENLENAASSLEELKAVHGKTARLEDFVTKAHAYKDEVIPAMKSLRLYCDKLENLLPKENWPFPDYTDLMYRV